MKFFTLIVMSLSGILTFAQKQLDTIYANEHKSVAIFFPRPIRQAVVGAPHFVFSYNREKEQYFGLLQGKPGMESNLLVVTNDGKIYSHYLDYSKELPSVNYFISETESIGNEKPLSNTEKVEIKSTEREGYYQRAAEILLQNEPTSIASKRNQGIKLQLEKMVYNGPEVFLVLSVKNRSKIPLQVDYFQPYLINGDNKRKSSYQRLPMPIIYVHKRPKLVLTGHTHRFVLVLPKFVPGEKEKLEIELKESNGNRKVQLLK